MPPRERKRKTENIPELVRDLVKQELEEFKKITTPNATPEESSSIQDSINDDTPLVDSESKTNEEQPTTNTEATIEDNTSESSIQPVNLLIFRPDLKIASYFMIVVSILVGLFYLSDRIFAVDVVTAILHNRVMCGFLLILSIANTLILYQSM